MLEFSVPLWAVHLVVIMAPLGAAIAYAALAEEHGQGPFAGMEKGFYLFLGLVMSLGLALGVVTKAVLP